MDIKKLAIGFAGAIAGNYIAEKWVLKMGPDDPTGFVPVADGLGLDDAARAATIVAVTFLVNKFI
jgi:hypothetical protein